MIKSDEVVFRILDIFRSLPKNKKSKDIFIALLFLKRVSDVYQENKMNLHCETNDLNQSDSHIVNVPESASWQQLLKIKGELSQHLLRMFSEIEERNAYLNGALTSLSEDMYALTKDEKYENSMFRVLQDLSLIPMGNRYYDNKKQFSEIFDVILSKISQDDEGGENSTPTHIAKLLAAILNPKDGTSIHDPFCGIGRTLVKCGKYAEENGGKVSISGQEINKSAWRYCLYSLIVNNYLDSVVKMGDTIYNPEFVEGETLSHFDMIVSVPPFGKGNWGHEIAAIDKYNRFRYGIPPKSTGDLAYLQHIIACLKDTGKAVVVLHPGILFRGGPEGEIRQRLILNDFIETIILLPSKVFTNTSIQTIVAVISMSKSVERKNSILFVSGDRLGEEKKRQIVLNDTDIDKIVSAYRDFKDIEKFCRVVSLEEIQNNDYSLNFSLYVNVFPEIEIVDVKKTLQEIREIQVEKEHLMSEIINLMNVL